MTVLETERPLLGPPARSGWAGRSVLVLAILTIVAVLTALFFGVRLGLALADDDVAVAQARDAVLVDARQAAVDLNTIDSADIQSWLDRWLDRSTGAMHEEVLSKRAEFAKSLADARRSTEATAIDAAVAELDRRAGRAVVLLEVDVVVRAQDQQPALSRIPLRLEMARTPEGPWKVSQLLPVR